MYGPRPLALAGRLARRGASEGLQVLVKEALTCRKPQQRCGECHNSIDCVCIRAIGRYFQQGRTTEKVLDPRSQDLCAPVASSCSTSTHGGHMHGETSKALWEGSTSTNLYAAQKRTPPR